MKFNKTKATCKAGVLYVEKVVNDHGSVFRSVHQEDDIGIDGFIELVKAEVASGRLVAVQIKAGDSYLASSGDEFAVDIDERHLDYWLNFMVPVILICYSPGKNCAAWVSVRDYVESEAYHQRLPVKHIRVPFYQRFDANALSKAIAGLAHARADERVLLRSADMCLSEDAKYRRDGFLILANHPDSRRLRITCLFARRLLMDPNIDTAKEALHILGYGVGRNRWSWNPNNPYEAEVISFAHRLCSDLSEEEIRRIIELVDYECFPGPAGLGERCFDVLCCNDLAQKILKDIASDKSQPMIRRANCLQMEQRCDEAEPEDIAAHYGKDASVADVVDWMSRPDSDQLDGAADT